MPDCTVEEQHLRPVLAAILAGGASRRYGAPKSFAELRGRLLIERVSDAVSAVADSVMVITGDPHPYERRGFACRSDLRPGCGPLGGLESALTWARESGTPGVLVVGCDMPFLSPTLLQAIVHASRAGRPLAVVPESPAEVGIEPLCTWYSIGMLSQVRQALDAGRRAIHQLARGPAVRRIPLEQVRSHGEPGRLFFNLNTPGDLSRARHMSEGEHASW